MTVIERETIEEVVTERERRARIFEAAAMEIEVRGWVQGWDCDPEGRVCAEGAVIFASGSEISPGESLVLDGRYDVAAPLFGEARFVITPWNDEPGRTADEVKFYLRWRAEEIRDGF